MHSPTFKKSDTKKNQLNGQSGSISPRNKLNKFQFDMNSVAQLQGNERAVQKRLDAPVPIPSLLMNSPTFNTLDNRFVELNPDSSRLHYNADGDPQTPQGSVLKNSENLFTNSPWPGLIASEPVVGFEDTTQPRLASPLVSKDGRIKLISGEDDSMLEPSVHQASYMNQDNTALLIKEQTAASHRISHQSSLQSQTNKSDKSKRKQPSQGAKQQLDHSLDDRQQRNQISPQRPTTPQNSNNNQSSGRKSYHKKQSQQQTTSPRKNNTRNLTSDDICENRSPLANTINVVSSDTFIDRQHSPVIKSRRNLTMNRSKLQDGYKKMNKVPYREMTQKMATYEPLALLKARKNDSTEKHSAHMVHRQRIGPIAQHIRIQAEQNRLNLKTREELISKKNNLLVGNPQAVRDSFDVSVDLAQINQNQANEKAAGFQFVRTRTHTKDLSKTKNNKIHSNFLKQSEILRMKPDGFRRISIQTDVEFGGGTQALGAGLHPLSSRVTNTIFEDENTMEDEESLMAFSESASSSILPKRRMKQKQVQIHDSVLQSRNESSRINDMLSNHNQQIMAPSIRKALNDRANFYRRKLTFYEQLGILGGSMTSQEIQAKLAEANLDLNSSHGTSILNRLQSRQDNRNSQISHNPTETHEEAPEADEKSYEQLPRPTFSESPNRQDRVVPSILAGVAELLNAPANKIDFRPKDMSPRRSRILDSIEDPTQNRQRSELPKTLANKERSTLVEIVQQDPPRQTLAVSKRASVFSTMMSTRAKQTSRECSPFIDQSRHPERIPAAIPQSRSQFKRVNVPSITGIGNQVWRRVNNESPPKNKRNQSVTPVVNPTMFLRVPDVKDARKNGSRSRAPKATRIEIRHQSVATNPRFRNLIKDLIDQRKPPILQPIRIIKAKNQQRDPQRDTQRDIQQNSQKVKQLAVKLLVSPLNQELKNLGPLIPKKLPIMTFYEPVSLKLKYEQRDDSNFFECLNISPSTHMDTDKPSHLNKQKAKKLVILQKAISQFK